jgi:hypothetical protein
MSPELWGVWAQVILLTALALAHRGGPLLAWWRRDGPDDLLQERWPARRVIKHLPVGPDCPTTGRALSGLLQHHMPTALCR